MLTIDQINDVINRGPFQANWASLTNVEIPAWFSQAKFGIFTHWGLYSVAEYDSEWYSRNMYEQGSKAFEHHRKTYGPQSQFGYKDFIPLFTAKKFSANDWLDVIKQSGAQYYMPVAEHHDGFQMYRSALSHYNAVEMGPHRDIIDELRQATLQHHLHFTTSNHRAEHWWFMGGGKKFASDVKEPLQRGDFYWPAMPRPDDMMDVRSRPYPTQAYLDDWLLRVCELIDEYRPEMLYFDWWIQHEAFKPYLQRLAAFYYNRGHEWGMPVIINYKYDGMAWGSGIIDVERGGFSGAKPFVWQTDTAIARNSWSYVKPLAYKSVNELLQTLIDTVSKNGNLLLNFGPKPDGSIAAKDREILLAIGHWLDVNGEGIYHSKPWRIAEEGPTQPKEGAFSDSSAVDYGPQDFRFTTNQGAIYIWWLAPGEKPTALVRTFSQYQKGGHNDYNGIINGIVQLGKGPVPFQMTPEGLKIQARKEADHRPIGFKLLIA